MSESPFSGTVVVGAGIVGLCVALALREAGEPVRLLDGQAVGSGTSFGNAGLISVDSVVPVAAPGMARNVPRWLLDPSGPLAIDRASLRPMLPWLLRWLGQTGMAAVERNSDGMRALHQGALERYAALLGPEPFARLIRRQGQVHVWNSATPGAGERLAHALNDRQGVRTQALGRGELHDLVPGLAPGVSRGLLYPRGAHTVEPIALTRCLAERLVESGGELAQREVLGIVPQGTHGVELLTSQGSERAARLVLCTGPRAPELLRPLGARACLFTERGYHAHLAAPSLALPLPVLHKELGLAFTPMQSGLRVAGTVELALRERPPSWQRAQQVLQAATTVFPGLTYERRSLWMGSRPSTPDSLPVIDRLPHLPQVAMAFGHGHFGMTGAPRTAELLRDLLADGPLAAETRRRFGLQRF